MLKPKMLIVTIYNRLPDSNLFKKKIRVQNLKICLQDFQIKIFCKSIKWKSRAEFHSKQNHISKFVVATPIRELPDWPLKLIVLLIFWLWYIFLMTCIKSVVNTEIIMMMYLIIRSIIIRNRLFLNLKNLEILFRIIEAKIKIWRFCW